MWLFSGRGATQGIASAILLLLPCVLSCERRTPVPKEVVFAAKATQSAEAANAAALAAGKAPLGQAPPLVESPFARSRSPGEGTPTKSSSCALDQLEGAEATDLNLVEQDETVRFVGWAADGATSTVPNVVALELSRAGSPSYYASGTRATKRPDVAAALKVPAFVNSGYDVLASFSGVEKGEYAVSVIQVSPSGAPLTCDTRKRVKVE